MKRRFWPVLSLVLALACGALLFLWQGERAEPDVDDLWLRSMNGAYERFSYYMGGNEAEYWYGVAELHTMADCAVALNMDGSGSADAAAEALAAGNLTFDPNAHCDHHGHHHEEGHACGDHGCGSHCGGHCGEH